MAHLASTSVLLDEIQEVGKSYVSGDTSARLRLLDLCGKLEREVERPAETLFKLGWARVRTVHRTMEVKFLLTCPVTACSLPSTATGDADEVLGYLRS